MTTQEKLIKAKLNLLELGAYLGNVSEACRTLGYSRDTFYRVTKLHEAGRVDALREASRRERDLRNPLNTVELVSGIEPHPRRPHITSAMLHQRRV